MPGGHAPRQEGAQGYFIDEVLRDASYEMQTTISPTAIKVIWEEDVRLLTSNGVHAIDEHTAHLPVVSLTSLSQLRGIDTSYAKTSC